MIHRRQRVAALTVALLLFSIAQFYAQPKLTATRGQNLSTQAVPMIGRLEVHRSGHIRVDDQDADSGSTILDGQLLETSTCVSATVHLLPVGTSSTAADELGEVELAANTRAVIHYGAGRAQTTLIRGCVRERRISSGLDATIDSPDGSSTRATQPDPDIAGRTRTETCYPVNENRDYRPDCVAPIIFGLSGATAVIGLALFQPCTRGSDTSPTAPSGQCQ